MVFKKKKEVKEEINESELIDLPEEGAEELPEIEAAEPRKATPEELKQEIADLQKQIVEEEKEIEEMDKVEEEPVEQVQIPQQPRIVFMNDTDLIRQTFSDVQALRVEVQNLKYIIETEIAKE